MTPIEQSLRSAMGHHRRGDLTTAEELYRRILDTAPPSDPVSAQALYGLGVIAAQTGHQPEAMAILDRAAQLAPDDLTIQTDAGTILLRGGKVAEALHHLHNAVKLAPQDMHLRFLLGAGLVFSRKGPAAVEELSRVVAAEPENASAWNNLVSALQLCGRFPDAADAHRRSIKLDPNDAPAWLNLGTALADGGNPAEALDACRRAIELQPQSPLAHGNLASVLTALDRIAEAEAHQRRAVELGSNMALAWHNLGLILIRLSRMEEARHCLQRALEIEPGFVTACSARLLPLLYDPRLSTDQVAAEHFAFGQRFESTVASRIRPIAASRDPDRILRVGLLSGDLRSHVVGHILLSLLEAIQPEHRLQFFAYATTSANDSITRAIAGRCAGFRVVTNNSDDELADLIRADAIDIAIDLSGHTGGGRLMALAQQPAPVRATHIGYPGTTGLKSIQWRITDTHLDPPSTSESLHSEQLLRLPDCAWCYAPLAHVEASRQLPLERNGFVTFASLNNPSKVNDLVLQLWARLLESLPDARLKLLRLAEDAKDGMSEQRLVRAGIDPARCDFVSRGEPGPLLEQYRDVDIALDTFPYTGGVTSLDALAQGVPVVTLAGKSCVQRQGVSILTNLGMTQWIAESPAQYLQIAADIAKDATALASHRTSLPAMMRASPLMDYPRFARAYAQALRSIWTRYCQSATD